ncbi:bolA-like protein 2 isoform X2 [Ceratina calcarata]|uniref:BolA-like protein 2 isoform X2 n=1 Tax=Ceratina calcarata TaxID=156304 RepID=A0AAJ7WCC3_9HYME|nr:bolA-like protein 2 isoform X2 [Ceratina calcarata]
MKSIPERSSCNISYSSVVCNVFPVVPRIRTNQATYGNPDKNFQPLNMTYTESYIKSKLTEGLNASHVEVTDESDGCGAKFSVTIVSSAFEGKPLLQRHRYLC